MSFILLKISFTVFNKSTKAIIKWRNLSDAKNMLKDRKKKPTKKLFTLVLRFYKSVTVSIERAKAIIK